MRAPCTLELDDIGLLFSRFINLSLKQTYISERKKFDLKNKNLFLFLPLKGHFGKQQLTFDFKVFKLFMCLKF